MQEFEELLTETSRTFALSIPYLPSPLRQEVTLAYLMFRIADSFEDAVHWPVAKRVEALYQFQLLLQKQNATLANELAAQWVAQQPLSHAGYLRLIGKIPAVLEAFHNFPHTTQQVMREHLLRSIQGMMEFVKQTDSVGKLVLQNLEQLQNYCYSVAGIVGEMLTNLFFLHSNFSLEIQRVLGERARIFGEALQLVNILKDTQTDQAEGRCYAPQHIPREQLFSLARKDLSTAVEYIQTLVRAGAATGIVKFTAFPVMLAWATLDQVEQKGAGAKVTREEVLRMEKVLQEKISTQQSLDDLINRFVVH